MATITQELAASRDVLSMIEHYKQNSGPVFSAELDVLTADMRSGSYEAALTRFEARFNSPLLSDIVRGLIGVLRGDNGVHYFSDAQPRYEAAGTPAPQGKGHENPA